MAVCHDLTGPQGPQGAQGDPGAAGIAGIGAGRGLYGPGGGMPQCEPTGLAVGTDGLGLMACRRYLTGETGIAHCIDVACSGASFHSAYYLGWGVQTYPGELAIGADGLGLVPVVDAVAKSLKVIHCVDVPCTSVTLATVATTNTADAASITIGADGLGIIAYEDAKAVKVAHCSNATCSSVSVTILAAASPKTSGRPRVVIGADGLPLVAFGQGGLASIPGTLPSLVVAHCRDVACAGADSTIIDSAGSPGGQDVLLLPQSIAIGPDNRALIAYRDGFNGYALRIAHCSDVACTSATLSQIAAQSNGADLVIGADGLGLVVNTADPGLGLESLHCQDITCSHADTQTLFNLQTTGAHLIVGSDGLGLIVYGSRGGDSYLYSLHLGDTLGMVHAHRR
jgi:hypothetical protein